MIDDTTYCADCGAELRYLHKKLTQRSQLECYCRECSENEMCPLCSEELDRRHLIHVEGFGYVCEDCVSEAEERVGKRLKVVV